MTDAPVRAAASEATQPEFIRLPKSGKLCDRTGLSRSYLNFLILPSEANKFKPVVKSVCLRKQGSRTGVRLIVYASLLEYLRKHEEKSEVAA